MVAYAHAGQNHLDDFLAVITARLKGYEIKRVPRLPDELAENDIAIDIGQKWDGERYFDHHHDSSLPCSAALLWEAWSEDRLCGALAESDALEDLNLADTKVGILGLPESRRPDRIQLRALLEAEPALLQDTEACRAVLEVFAVAKNLREFVERCYADPRLQPILQAQLQRTLAAEREEERLIQGVEVREVGGVRIGVSREPLARAVQRAFESLQVDALIAPNEREPDKVSVVRDSQGRYGDRTVSELFPALAERATFRHAAGFMMVCALSVDEALALLG